MASLPFFAMILHGPSSASETGLRKLAMALLSIKNGKKPILAERRMVEQSGLPS